MTTWALAAHDSATEVAKMLVFAISECLIEFLAFILLSPPTQPIAAVGQAEPNAMPTPLIAAKYRTSEPSPLPSSHRVTQQPTAACRHDR